MTWAERQRFYERDYERASFKGAPFWVEAYGLDAGRRQSVQRFPGTHYTNVQDLGPDSSTITVTAFLLGDDYDFERDTLKRALLEGGEGELRLPFVDPLKVTVINRIRVDESQRERGFCTITFDCVETSIPPTVIIRDARAQIGVHAANGRELSEQTFLERFQVGDLDAGSEGRRKLRDGMQDVSERLYDMQNKFSASVAVLPDTAIQAQRLFSSINSLVGLPLDLSDAIVDAVNITYSSLRSTADISLAVVQTWGRGGPLRILMDTTFDFTNEYVPPTISTATSTGDAAQIAIDAWYLFVRMLAVYQLAELLTELEYDSRQQALAVRSDYIEGVGTLAPLLTGLDYENFADLNEAVFSYLDAVSLTLPEASSYTPSSTLPVSVIAWILYGDSRYADEIVARNAIRHPGFVEAGTELEVLNATRI